MTLTPGEVLVLAVLGGVGAAARYLVDDLVNRWWARGFPLATLCINVSGSFLIGLLAVTVGPGSSGTYAVWATGFCGGYTTFSTATVEAVRLAREGAVRQAVVAAGGTLVLCVAAVALGVLTGRLLG
ncbi:fluoride efflux transporter FluC [Ornithinimicrobium cavernae]|uniref:fluoride efflux transporter FluC n=1 Tax=Ornithinimicrobium cavernae TaxID=2666047 RepID=UPI000D687F0B|nr:CrcB family protein [Ornithinimicrobium cavernae]